jgi:hypothetical protein
MSAINITQVQVLVRVYSLSSLFSSPFACWF